MAPPAGSKVIHPVHGEGVVRVSSRGRVIVDFGRQVGWRAWYWSEGLLKLAAQKQKVASA